MPCNRPISGKPDAAAPHVRFDEGGGGPPAPPLLDCFRDFFVVRLRLKVEVFKHRLGPMPTLEGKELLQPKNFSPCHRATTQPPSRLTLPKIKMPSTAEASTAANR